MYSRKWFDLRAMAALGTALAAGCATGADPWDEAVATTEAPLLAADASSIIPDRYIVIFKDQAAAQGMESAMSRITLASADSHIERVYRVIPGFAARLSRADLAAIRRNPAVAWVEHDQELRVEPMAREQLDGVIESRPGSEPEFGIETIYPLPGGQPDGIDRVDQPSLPRDSQYNDHGCSGVGVRAYLIDTGVRSTHAELAGRVDTARGFTAIDDGLGTEDCLGQGTFLASIIAGTQFGMAKNATVVPVRVADCIGAATTTGIISGIEHVADDCGGAQCVANMALGGGASSALDSAVNALVAGGVPLTVPIGSNGCSGSPARALSATGVLGVNDADCPTNGIAGTCVDVYGPATSILGASAAGDNATMTLSSTGAAAAHAAGALAQGLSCGFTGLRTTTAVCASPAGTKPLVFNDYGAESCKGRCGGFDPLKPCQCDRACRFFGDCCADEPFCQ